MTQTSSTPAVTCRPAQTRDRADVFEFCKGIWEGDDYVPEVWDEWFNDPHGVLAVAELDGHTIGCSKVTRMSDTQWWLEGFRVDPKLQGLKIGTVIHNYVTDWWLQHCDGALRLMTDGRNFAVHRLCEKTGYIKTHEVCGYKAFPLAETTTHFSPVNDLHEAVTFSNASGSIRATDGLTDFGWRIGTIDKAILESYASDQADYHHDFYWWKDQKGLFSFYVNEDKDQRIMHIGIVACTITEIPALLMDVRRLAAQNKLDAVVQIALDTPPIISQFEAAGFEKHWKRSNAFIFEKRHPGRV